MRQRPIKLPDIELPWLGPVTVSNGGIATDTHGRFGLGAVLIVERRATQQLLLVRKSARPGFEGNDQFAFPGGMVRPDGTHTNVSDWIAHSLQERVLAEVHVDLTYCSPIAMLPLSAPIVAAYTARGQRRHTAILPFHVTVGSEFHPWVRDPTVYDPGWRDVRDVWSEITPTNRLIAAHYVWSQLTAQERRAAQPSVAEAVAQASVWAAEIGFLPPRAPWS